MKMELIADLSKRIVRYSHKNNHLITSEGDASLKSHIILIITLTLLGCFKFTVEFEQ